MKNLNDGSNDKRIFIILVVTLFFFMGYPYILEKMGVETKGSVEEAGLTTTIGENGDTKTIGAEGISEEKKKNKTQDITENIYELTQPAAASAEKLITVETPLYIATFSNQGGAVKSWKLKNYRKELDGESPLVNIVNDSSKNLPLFSRVNAPGIPETIEFKGPDNDIKVEEKPTEIVYRWNNKNGVRVIKKYIINPNDYSLDITLSIENSSVNRVVGETFTTLFAEFPDADKYYHQGPVRQSEGDVDRQDYDEPDIDKGETEAINMLTGTSLVEWIALEDKYFFMALLPKSKGLYKWKSAFLNETTSFASVGVPLDIKPGTRSTLEFSSYLGPKEYDRLLSYKRGLEGAIEFGIFSFLAKPFLVVVKFLQNYLINYGRAIIILTVLIKILFYPLTKHSLKSMKKMSVLTPQLQLLKKKYKDDKQRQNKETMELYRRHKVNPLSGCLPMLMQMPVFIALYEVFYVAIELRHAPFMLWIVDLSAKDPYYITPIVMGISMFVQQKMTPSAMDPMQQKMMLFMPVVLTFVFLNFPAGLVLYWLTNNILSIAQQYKIHREATETVGASTDKKLAKNKKE